jgi:hypothetical protein
MPRFVLRIWLPDRPGALGLVASRIGGARGDVIGIEILEQGAGRAIDELVVELPEGEGVDPLLRAVTAVDGVDVEWVQSLGHADHDPQLALLEAAARLVEAGDQLSGLALLCTDVRRAFEADWAVVVDLAVPAAVAGAGDVPDPSWLVAFVNGSRHLSGEHELGAEDVAWAELPGQERVLAVGRGGRPFRARERRQLGVLGRISATTAHDELGTQPRARSTARSQVS